MIPGRWLLLAAVTVMTAGCAASRPEPLYRWGEYEQLIYEMYAKPGKAEPGAQVTKLSADVERTLAEGKRVPPGVHAHLGYMYFLQGNRPAALHEFSTERDVFPESAVFVDGVLKRLQGGGE